MVLPWNRDTSTIRSLGLQGITNYEATIPISNCQLSSPMASKGGSWIIAKHLHIYKHSETHYCTGNFLSNRVIRHWKAPNATIEAYYMLYMGAAPSWSVRKQSSVSLELQLIASEVMIGLIRSRTLLWRFQKYGQVMIDLIRFYPCQNENLQHSNRLWLLHLTSFSHFIDSVIQQDEF